MKAIHRIIEQAQKQPKRIVLCEAEDARVLAAAQLTYQQGIADIILIGSQRKIQTVARDEGIDVDGMEIIDPGLSDLSHSFAISLYEMRAKKGMSQQQAKQEVQKPLCFANLMVKHGLADGSVAGAVHTTGDVVRNAIQLIGMAKGSKLVSSFFLMMLCQPFHHLKGGMIFSDCGLVVDPDEEQLADIALSAAGSARSLLMVEPKVAMLSFSTNGSAKHSAVDKVIAASERVKHQAPELAIDNDVQLDAAIVAEIAQRKLPDSKVKGQSNVLVFPNLEAGNIGYKLAERVGGAVAIGPLLQGLAKPANDLSRGCSVDDIYHVIAVTVVQAQQGPK